MCLKIDWIYRAVAKKASITHAVRYTPCQNIVFQNVLLALFRLEMYSGRFKNMHGKINNRNTCFHLKNQLLKGFVKQANQPACSLLLNKT